MSSGFSSSSPTPPSVDVQRAQSAFGNRQYVETDLGGLVRSMTSSVSRPANNGKRSLGFRTTTRLAPQLNAALNQAQTGLNANTGFLSQTPVDQFNDLRLGLNPFYNAQALANEQLSQAALGSATERFAQSGLENSTARGSFEAQLSTDSLLRDLTTQNEALRLQNELALNNAAFQQGLVESMASLMMNPAKLTNNTLIDALTQADRLAMFNAQQENRASLTQASQAFQSEMEQYRQEQRRQTLLGRLAYGNLSRSPYFRFP